MKILIRFSNWLNGWRYDLDGWLVRARRASDTSGGIAIRREGLGFVEEACIAVRTHEIAYAIDHGLIPKSEE